jgi:hypothetical protein
MAPFSQARSSSSAPVSASELMRRKPQRVCATLPWHLHQQLQLQADMEGRSLSNLISHLLEMCSSRLP